MQKRMEWIDASRGLAAVFVLVAHSYCPDIVKQTTYIFLVPIFFILSGYLYNKEKWEQKGIKELVTCKFKAFMIPYFGLAMINLLLNIPVEFFRGIRGAELLKSTLSHIVWTIYSYGSGGRMPICTPLWYLPCAFIAFIYLYYVLKSSQVGQFIICIVALVGASVLDMVGVVQLPWHIDAALYGMVLMYFGFCIRKYNLLEINNRVVVIALLLVVGYACTLNNGILDINNMEFNNMALSIIGTITISLAILLIMYKYNRSHFLKIMGQNSILVMGFNFAINTYLEFAWKRLPIIKNVECTWWMRVVIDIIVCLIVIDLFNKLARKLKWMNIIVGR